MSTSNRIRLVLAEPNLRLRKALAEYFNLEDDIEVVGQAANNTEVEVLCRQLKPDVLIVDPILQSTERAAFIRRLHAENPDMKMIVLTAPFNGVSREGVLEAGATEYLEKGIFASDLVGYVRRVYYHPRYSQNGKAERRR
jgi:DNA-binding NarL/FixJ family response regulator